jgi:hypothetical protein
MTLRFVPRYARGAGVVAIGDNTATWGADGGQFSVSLTVDYGTYLFACTLEDGETQAPRTFDLHERQWILPDIVPPQPGAPLPWPRLVPRQAAHWLCSEASRLGARRVRSSWVDTLPQ